jgi:hypothetical protein
VPWYERRILVLALAAGPLLVSFQTIVFWIITPMVRRHYQRTLDLAGVPGILRLATRMVCVCMLASYIAWTVLLMQLSGDITAAPGMTLWFRLAQVLTILSAVLTIIALVNMIVTWFSRRWWWSKVWETPVGLACLAFVWLFVFARLWHWTLRY